MRKCGVRLTYVHLAMSDSSSSLGVDHVVCRLKHCISRSLFRIVRGNPRVF
jgi:hypothetical protein